MYAVRRAAGFGASGRMAAAAVAAVACVAIVPQRVSAAGITHVIAKTGAASPDGNGTFGALDEYPVINDAGQVAFVANLTGTDDGTFDDEGVYRGNGSSTTQMLRARRAINFQTGFSNFDPLSKSINGAGSIIVYGNRLLPTLGAVTQPTLFRSSGAAEQLVIAGQTLPGGNGAFLNFTTPNLNNAGDVTFAATHTNLLTGVNDSGMYYRSGATVSQIVREGQPAPDNDGVLDNFITSNAMNQSGQTAFYSRVIGSSGGAHDGTAIFRGGAGGFVQVARTGQAAPDGNGAFQEFYELLASNVPRMNDAGHVAFRAMLSGTVGGQSDNAGFYLWDGATTTKLVCEGETAMGGGVITKVLTMSLNNSDHVAYGVQIGPEVNEDLAIFRFDGTTHTPIVRTGQPTPGGDGSFSALGLSEMINEAGQVFFAARLEGTSAGDANDYGLYWGNGIDVIQVAREGQALAGSTITDISYRLGDFFMAGDGVQAFNESGQVAYRAELANGKQAIARFTIPDLHWTAASSGVWSGANFTSGILPNSFHHVFIDPATASPTVHGKSTDFYVRSLTIGTQSLGVSTLRVTNGGDLTALEGVTINTRGVINVGPLHTLTAPTVVNNGQLRGSGRVAATISNLAGGWLAVNSGDTFEIDGTGAHTNEGEIWAAYGELRFFGPLSQSPGGEINVQTGVLRLDGGLTNGGRLNIDYANNEIYGDVLNLPGGAITVASGGDVQFFGDVTSTGAFDAADGTRTTFHELFAGGGVGDRGDVDVRGEVRPGAGGALMSFGGNLDFGSRARLQIDIGGLTAGAEHDALYVAERVTLDGELEISPLMTGGAPFEPQPGDKFRIIEAGAVVDQFSRFSYSGFAPGLKFDLEYGDDEVALFAEAAFSADFDLDGQVDEADMAMWSANFGASGVGHTQGDADGNGSVDGGDFLLLQRQFGSSLPSPKASAALFRAVPEPGSAVLAAVIFAVLMSRRRTA